MGVLDKFGPGSSDERRAGLVEVRVSAHACPRCGCMVALDLADRHWAWHEALEPPAGPASVMDATSHDEDS